LKNSHFDANIPKNKISTFDSQKEQSHRDDLKLRAKNENLKQKLRIDLIEIFTTKSRPFSDLQLKKMKNLIDNYKLNSNQNSLENYDSSEKMSTNDISKVIIEVMELSKRPHQDYTFKLLEYVESHIRNISKECDQHKSNFLFDPKIHDIDETADCSLLTDSFATQFACVRIKGDGNCLWNSVSFSLIGDYSLMESLRLLTAATLVKYENEFKKHLFNQKKKFGYNHDLTFDQLVVAATELSVWGDEYHIIALSIALQRPIYSYGSFMMFIGEDLNFERLRTEYERETLANHIKYVGNRDHKNEIPICIHYNGENHYSAILPKKAGIKPLKPKMKIFDYVLGGKAKIFFMKLLLIEFIFLFF
jgi:hypothetical protein